MAKKISLNRISLTTIVNLSHKYRKVKWYYKLFAWLAIAGLPALALLDVNSKDAGLMFSGLATVGLILHILITYTKYVTLLIPNILHIMIMPFSFGLYWGSGISDTMTTDQFLSLYSQGSLFGIIYTVLTIPAVFKFTRGKPWLTFSIIYVLVDFLSLIFTQYMPQLGLLTPVVITTVVIFLRSKLFHKLAFSKAYTLSENSILDKNISKKNIGYFNNRLDETLSDHAKVFPLGEDSFFNYIIITKNRIFAAYNLELSNKLSITFQDEGTKLTYRGSTQEQELGVILQEASKLSRRWNIPGKDVTPIVLGNRLFIKKQDFLGIHVTKKGASVKGSSIDSGMVYFVSVTGAGIIETAWKKHTLTKKSMKLAKKLETDDSGDKESTLPEKNEELQDGSS